MSSPIKNTTSIPSTFKIGVITLSDRASQGIYEDKSGLLIQQMITDFLHTQTLDADYHYTVIPDEPHQLKTNLQALVSEGYHYIFTTGSTGIGPRDIAPDVIQQIIDKEIPGIMEFIRMKYGAIIPNALLSRSIAGVANQTVIYALPGSPKAVKEYLEEIFKTMIHCHLMIIGGNH